MRISFITRASTVELEVLPQRIVYLGADRPRGHVDVLIDGQPLLSDPLTGGDAIEIDLTTGTSAQRTGTTHVTRVVGLPNASKLVELLLPHNESLTLIGLRSDAPIITAPCSRPVWLHHGSSISQGSNALTPAQIWPAVAARSAGVDLHNLGLGSSALVDPFTAQTMRDTPADLISVKLGINIVGLDGMRLRSFVPAVHGFLDLIREGHPDTPLLLISPLHCGIHENTPGPGAFDPNSFGTGQVRFIASGTTGDTAQGRLTLEVVREGLRQVVAARRDDKQLFHLEGTELYGPQDAHQHPLPDALHPDAATHQLIGQRFAAKAFGPSGSFASAS